MRFYILATILATAAAAQPCEDYICDSLCVRSIRDANGIQQVSVESATDSSLGRIRVLHLPGDGCGDFSSLGTISVLSSTIGRLSALTYLDLSCNDIDSLPSAIADLHNLDVLQLKANRLQNLPMGIMTLPAIGSLILWDNPLEQVSPEFRVWADSAVPGWERALTLVSPVGGEVFHVGDSISIEWIADPRFVSVVDVALSLDGGDSVFYPERWTALSSNDPEWGSIRRPIDDPRWVSDSCLVILRDWLSPNHETVSPSVFSIMPRSSVRRGAVRGTADLKVRVIRSASGTRVLIAAPDSKRLSVSLHDIRGLMLRTLFEVGRHHAYLTVDLSGSDLTPGMYVIRVRAGDLITVVPIVL